MKLKKILYNTIVILLPFMLYYLPLIGIKDFNGWIYLTIITCKGYILWAIILTSYYGVYIMYKIEKKYVFLLPVITIVFTTYQTIHYFGSEGLLLIIVYYIPIVLASIVYPIGISRYTKLFTKVN